MRSKSACRSCGAALGTTFIDLGFSPLANSILTEAQLDEMEPHYPLHAYVCDACMLVQLRQMASPQRIFGDYSYFSSYSSSWLEHCKRYVEAMIPRLGLGRGSLVVELASNDGYLLQYFLAAGIPVLGIEPAANVAEVARAKGIETESVFFGRESAARLAAAGRKADLIVANNVLAHVPEVNDFVAGLPLVLDPGGTFTVEFPHLRNLIAENQFDTIYHEHFSYFSLRSASRILAAHGLRVYDVDRLATHGGSLRLYACHADNARLPATPRVQQVLDDEDSQGLKDTATYAAYPARVRALKLALLRQLIELKAAGKTIAGYGAPAKGNTLLNYCGIGPELLDYTVDVSPHKQGRYLPGSRIPIFPPERIKATRPDYVLILPWNLKEEIVSSMAHVRDWGGRFMVAVPRVELLP